MNTQKRKYVEFGGYKCFYETVKPEDEKYIEEIYKKFMGGLGFKEFKEYSFEDKLHLVSCFIELTRGEMKKNKGKLK
jgi:hypothetical protein